MPLSNPLERMKPKVTEMLIMYRNEGWITTSALPTWWTFLLLFYQTCCGWTTFRTVLKLIKKILIQILFLTTVFPLFLLLTKHVTIIPSIYIIFWQSVTVNKAAVNYEPLLKGWCPTSHFYVLLAALSMMGCSTHKSLVLMPWGSPGLGIWDFLLFKKILQFRWFVYLSLKKTAVLWCYEFQHYIERSRDK